MPNGPHYHIYGTGHYYPGMVVPEPYASIYFPGREWIKWLLHGKIIFSGVTSCIFTGENRTSLLGESINSWYSLPSYPYGALATTFLTKEEMEELNQHGIYKNNNIRKNIRIWEHTYNISPEKTEKLFKVVFFFSTPAFLEIECEKLLVEKFSET